MFLLFTTDNDSFQGCKGCILERLNVDLGFLPFNLEELGACAGMSGRENGTAILVGEDGGFEGIDLSGNTDDLFLIHTDKGTENGTFHYAVGNAERLHSLACYLTEAFARDQGITLEFLGGALGKSHHKAAKQEGKVVFLAVIAQDLLDLRDGNDVNVDLTREFRELFRKRQDLFLCAFAGIGEAFEMHGIEAYAALGDHKACNGAVNTARKEEQALTVGADWHTACRFFLTGADISGVIADLHAYGNLGVVNVNALLSVGFFKDDRADLCGDFGGGEGEFFIGALGFDLEGSCVFDIGHELRSDRVQDRIHVFFGFDSAVDRGNTKGIFSNTVSAVDIGFVIKRLDIEGALYGINLEFAVGSGSALQNIAQKLFKIRTVGSLKGNFAVFAKNDLFHYVILSDR